MGMFPTNMNPQSTFTETKWAIVKKAAELADKLGSLTTEEFVTLCEGLENISGLNEDLDALKNLKFEVEFLHSEEQPYTRWHDNTLYFGLPIGEKGEKGDNAKQVKLKLYYDGDTGNLYYRTVLTNINEFESGDDYNLEEVINNINQSIQNITIDIQTEKQAILNLQTLT